MKLNVGLVKASRFNFILYTFLKSMEISILIQTDYTTRTVTSQQYYKKSLKDYLS